MYNSNKRPISGNIHFTTSTDTAMDYSIESITLDKLQSECLLVGIYEKQQLSYAASVIDELCDGLIGKLIARGDIAGKNAENTG